MTDEIKNYVPLCDRHADCKNPKLVCIIERSNNEALVLYEAKFSDADKLIFDEEMPIHVYWLRLIPSEIKANRAKGKMDDREELTYMQRSLAYGVSFKKVEGKHNEYEVTFVALKTRTFILKIHDGQPVLFTKETVSGNGFHLERMYVSSVTRWMGLPKVEFVDIHGKTIESGESIKERIKP